MSVDVFVAPIKIWTWKSACHHKIMHARGHTEGNPDSVGPELERGPKQNLVHTYTFKYDVCLGFNKTLKCGLSFCCCSAKGQGVALLEREVQCQTRNSPGWRQQVDDRRLWQPWDLRQPGSHGRHSHILSQPCLGVHGARTQEWTYAQLKSDEDYPAQPGGCGALRGR